MCTVVPVRKANCLCESTSLTLPPTRSLLPHLGLALVTSIGGRDLLFPIFSEPVKNGELWEKGLRMKRERAGVAIHQHAHSMLFPTRQCGNRFRGGRDSNTSEEEYMPIFGSFLSPLAPLLNCCFCSLSINSCF